MWIRFVGLTGMLVIGLTCGLLARNVDAAPEGAPWYRTKSDVARTFNTRERDVFTFVTDQLIAGLDSADREVETFAETFARDFIDEFDLNPDGAEPVDQRAFTRDRREIQRLMLLVSPPADGGNGDTLFNTFNATVIVIEPTPAP